MHKQPIFIKKKIFSSNENYPNSEFMSKRGFYIPSGLGITRMQQKYIVSVIMNTIK